MFNPAQAITAGVLVFALGGAVLVVQPSGRPVGDAPAASPAASAELVEPTWITGTITHAPGCTGPDSTQDGDVRHDWNAICEPQTWTSSDERFTGMVSARFNEDVRQTDAGTITVGTTAYYLRTEYGGWTCTTTSLLKGSGFSSEMLTGDTVRCVGDPGWYEGLSALLIVEADPPGGLGETFVGLIFSGDVPPVPEPPAAE